MEKKLSNLKKATIILQILSRKPYQFSAPEISRISGINRTTVYRILSELAEDNFVVRNDISKKFTVGPMLYHIGSIYLHQYQYNQEIHNTLEKVAEITGESVGMAVREGNRIISLYEIETRRPFRMNHPPGSFYPMNRGCYGKCLMAYHDPHTVQRLLSGQTFQKLFPNTLTEPNEILEEYARIRKQGYVISNGEVYDPAAAGIGVPVMNPVGMVKACMAIAFIKGPDFESKTAYYLSVLKKYAENLSQFIP